MLILLPPSETKRPGGDGAPLRVDELAFAGVARQRRDTIDALVSLAERPQEMTRALKLSARQQGEIEVNGSVRSAATLPAVDRFTGVLYDALDAPSLPTPARAWLGAHAAIQTALLGPVGALDPVPDFRLSAGHRLPGLPPMSRHWAAPTESSFAAHAAAPILDLRSEAYRALGPVPSGREHAFVRVVRDTGDGRVRALNHFNKKAKGLFTRALALHAPVIRSIDDIVDWARGAGFEMRPAPDTDELLLVAPDAYRADVPIDWRAPAGSSKETRPRAR